MRVGAGLPPTLGRPLVKTSTAHGRAVQANRPGGNANDGVEQARLDDALSDAAGAAALE